MKKKYFNKKAQQRAKLNLKKNGTRRKLFSKRLGGVLDASMILENRDVDALSNEKNKII